jgi:hypothetical protein
LRGVVSSEQDSVSYEHHAAWQLADTQLHRGDYMACDDLLRCSLAALLMVVVVTVVPLFLYWLWTGLSG